MCSLGWCRIKISDGLVVQLGSGKGLTLLFGLTRLSFSDRDCAGFVTAGWNPNNGSLKKSQKRCLHGTESSQREEEAWGPSTASPYPEQGSGLSMHTPCSPSHKSILLGRSA